jgi:hypothetical protein
MRLCSVLSIEELEFVYFRRFVSCTTPIGSGFSFSNLYMLLRKRTEKEICCFCFDKSTKKIGIFRERWK